MGPRSGSLVATADQVTELAMGLGALMPIATEHRWIEQGGVRFLVRVVSSLARKHRERTERSDTPVIAEDSVDPFLPYDPALFVADVSDTHVCLLNKFNVIDRHLLIVTRAFEDQEMLLNAADFGALSMCMAEIDGLGFYNGGAAAGASQRHKHLQLVPLPIAEGGPRVPIETLIEAAEPDRTVTRVPGLSFRHAFARLDAALFRDPGGAAEAMLGRYHALLDAAGLDTDGGEIRQSAPYNLLLTRAWMLLVPRSRECFQTISVNALGFAGSLFARDARQMQTIEYHGPMTVLRGVAVG